MKQRGSGILAHISSLPGNFGIGDLGPGVNRFIDFLVDCGQKYWQFLPVGQVSSGFDFSPYMGLSAFAGNSLLISPELLLKDGYLEKRDLENIPDFSEYRVEFAKVQEFKKVLLQKAYAKFVKSSEKKDYLLFCKQEKWLDDYALFMSLRDKYNYKAWSKWPGKIAKREKQALSEISIELKEEINFYKFSQFCFFSQWQKMKKYAADNNISLIGDIPIYVGFDSADVWSNQDIFRLNKKTLQPELVAGVPPDFFSKTGQRWGNPLYSWESSAGKENKNLYKWWKLRFKCLSQLVDIVRIDHFRGFESFWAIPAKEKTAVNGSWVKGPGKSFFRKMASSIAQLDIIAEDLGIITPEVTELRENLGYCGMKILQFAFDSDNENSYLPCNYNSTKTVVYSGTHDNSTSIGWYLSPLITKEIREKFRHYANSKSENEIHWDLIRLALSSIAATAIIPLQDLLGFGDDCRMNIPGTSKGNWRWRCASRFLSDEISSRFRKETKMYNRSRNGCSSD
jgi:4-alpha-glucanotransferase